MLLMDEIKQLTKRIIDFRDARDWEQFHNSKDLALAISIEAAELLELFLWKGNEEANPDKIKEELADIFTFSLMLAQKHGLDVSEIVNEKIKLNEMKYPVEKSKGSSKKYTEL
jgi:NTP pyrophosphatase (non-canonical NTP hydrolase)